MVLDQEVGYGRTGAESGVEAAVIFLSFPGPIPPFSRGGREGIPERYGIPIYM